MGDFHVPIKRNRAGTFCPVLEKTPQAWARKTLKTYPRGVYAHQTSHGLAVEDTPAWVMFEALSMPNLTKRPKAKQDAAGRFLPHGATAQAGLNRAIVSSAGGPVGAFTRYKRCEPTRWSAWFPSRPVHRNVPGAHSLPRTIGCVKPNSSVNAVDSAMTPTTEREAWHHPTAFGRSADQNQTPADFSEARAGTVRSHAWGGSDKTRDARGSRAMADEPGTSGSDPGNPRLGVARWRESA